MLIKFGAAIADARGKIGGMVFSRNRYGNYARTFKVPVNPNSSAQQAVRADMGNVVASWFAILSIAQRAAWDVFAAAINKTNKLGETITLTGFNQYVATNIARRSAGMTLITEGPTNLTLPPTDPVYNVSLSQGTQLITINFDDNADWVSQDSAFMSISQGIPQNSARSFFGGHTRIAGRILGNNGSPPTSPQTIAVTFPVAVTMRDWIRGRIQEDDGRLSETFRDDAVVGA